MKNLKRPIYYTISIIVAVITFINAYKYNIGTFRDAGEHKFVDLNNTISHSRIFIDMLTIYGNNYFKQNSSDEKSDLYDVLTYNSDLNIYALDSIGGSEEEKYYGNLTGLGRIPNSGFQKSEVNLALSYNSYFYELFNQLPEIAWVYYTSENNFVNMYPWTSSDKFRYSEKLKNIEFYKVANPSNNPLREAVWTPVYLDEGGKGLMVSISSPIYYEDTFIGVVSIDFTTQTIRKMLNGKYDSYLIDKENSVIATGQNLKFDDGVKKINELLGISTGSAEQLNRIKSDSVERIGMNYVYKYNIDAAPWEMIVVTPVYFIIFKSTLFTLPIIIICYLFIITLIEVEHRKKTEEIFSKIAITDELTQLKNRHFLDSVIDEEFARADRYNEHISIIIFDLDHFKKVNDTWGHPIGDEVLKQTADIANKIIRKSDILIRFGGEEFLIMLPKTDIDGAHELAEKIRKALEDRNHYIAGRCTASFGIAERIVGEGFNNFYKRADEALYYAKSNGRNCTVSYESMGELPFVSIHMQWNNRWNSGDVDIDRQHREILELANKLVSMSLSELPYEKIQQQLDIILENIILHFSYEEKLQAKIGYPDYVEHAIIHQELLQKALKLKESYKREEIKSSAFFTFVVDDVIMGHMQAEDEKYFPYIADMKNKML